MKFYTSVEQAGNRLLVRGYNNGDRYSVRVPFNPTLFLPTKNFSKWKTLEGECVEPHKFGSISEAREFVKQYKEIPDFDIYGNTRFLYQYIAEQHPEEELKFDSSKIRIFNIDIETAAENGFPDIESADQEILAISIKDSFSGRITVFGARPYDNKDPMVDYMHFRSEESMMNAFLDYWQANYPDVITGWNVQLFDMPYICNRIERILGEKFVKLLSPWRLVSQREIFIKGRKQFAVDTLGISTLDYLELYKKFTYSNQESYRLDYICNVELGEKKLDHSEFDTFKEFYENDWQKFIDYNIHDVRLVDKLEDKMKLIELAYTMAYDAKVNYEDVFSQVRMWDNYIYNELNKRRIAIPPKKEATKNEKYAGAYVKEPKPGFYDWVVSFDLNSLYPHLIMQYNISPETLRESRHPSASVEGILNQKVEIDKQFATCANGAQYRKDVHGFLPEMMKKMYDSRVIFKKRMIKAKQQYEKTPTVELTKEIARCNNIQMAKKISLNSAYGAIGNEHFRYYKTANAEAITLSGQVSIRWIENKMNRYLNKLLSTEKVDYVIASDTDSIYLNLGPLVDKFFAAKSSDKTAVVSLLDKICQEKLEPFIEKSYQELASYVSAYEQKMSMKRENIADRGIWTAKKRYILNVWDSEGVRYNEPKMKIMGLETARSSTPAYFRDKLYAAFQIIIGKDIDELISFINGVRSETRERPYDEVAFPRGVNNLSKYRHPTNIYSKGTPIHVRGALLYNWYVKKYKVEHKHPFIQEGEKIKFMYLKTPNPLHENCISFFGELPKEFGIEKYVDYQTQFEKSFLEPLKNVLQCIGWTHEKVITIGRFFE
jgi:DNA polymerase elongation subunit (family B)